LAISEENEMKNKQNVFWLIIIAWIAVIILVAISLEKILDSSQVYVDPDGDCVKVVHIDRKGDCGMLPNRYDVIHVPFKKEIEYVL